jgi:hypothetical protein
VNKHASSHQRGEATGCPPSVLFGRVTVAGSDLAPPNLIFIKRLEFRADYRFIRLNRLYWGEIGWGDRNSDFQSVVEQ